ncbi:DUF2461 domain-containing protein [Aquipuribacter sp. MA13-6]|uniref:DUF2461 domain-containing protein n=1 Tax=unclassified Aquipuribacter TaxID=2635084 RepID=UPI003EE852D5
MSDTTAPFTGFGEGMPLFFEGLEADNSKAYWTDQRPVYEEHVRAPMLALLAALEPEFGATKMFRPYRDVRFSHDKTPYKTHAAGVVNRTDGRGSLYLHVDADGLLVGGGSWRMERDQVVRFREAVADDGTGRALVRVVTRLSDDGWTTAGDTLVRAPRGYDPAHPRIDLLRHKGFAMSRHHELEDWVFGPGAVDVVAEHWRAVAPLDRWLARHVGPPVPQATDRDQARRL